MEKYYSVNQASAVLGIKVRTVREWIHTNKLRAVKYPGSRNWHIAESELMRITNKKEAD